MMSPAFITLTLANSKDQVYINANMISSLKAVNGYTEVRVGDPYVYFKVSDTPDEIIQRIIFLTNNE